MAFYEFYQDVDKGKLLLGLNVGFFFLMLLIGEVFHRLTLTKEQSFNITNVTITKEDFDERVSLGEKLVILDGFVLNIADFITHHPGGKFALSHNVGRDISKFFYGGYSMEGNMTNPQSGHVHTNYARIIVNSLIIGNYEKHITVQSTICKVNMEKTIKVNETTAIFFFESEDG